MQVALLKDSVVFAVVDASTEEEIHSLATKHEQVIGIDGLYPAPAVGWVFLNNKLVPGPGQFPVYKTKISKLAFKLRMTGAERALLKSARTEGSPSYNASVADIADLFDTAVYIDLAHPVTIQGTYGLAALGILTMQRAAAILNTPPTEDEVWKEGK